jgi:cysteine desulfurase family protein
MIYLNNASTGYPKPASVLSAVNDFINSPPHNYGRTGIDAQHTDIITKCRKNLANFFNIKNEKNIIFTPGSTYGLNLAIGGLKLKDCNVIITNTEHNSVIRPLNYLKKRNNVDIKIVNSDKCGFVNPDEIISEIDENTRLIIINHCSNVTGAVQDVAAVSQLAKKYNVPVLIDASQSAGAIDINMESLDVDFMAFTGHKSLMGLQGIGGLYIKDEAMLEPIISGGTGFKSSYPYQPEEMPYKFEAGTMNMAGIVALNAGIQWINSLKLENIINHKQSLLNELRELTSDIENLHHYDTQEKSSHSVFCFNLLGISPEEVNYILAQSYNIHIRSGLHCAPLIISSLPHSEMGTLRASVSYFSTIDEIETFINAIKKIAGMIK